MILWIYGQSGSGKSTIIKKLRTIITTALLDSEALHEYVAPDIGFGKESRRIKYHRFARMAKAINHDMDVIVETISPHENLRRDIRQHYSPLMICVWSPRSVCKERDPKGLWKIADKEGWDMPFEDPNPKTFDLLLDTTKTDVDGCIKAIIDIMEESKRLC